MKTVGQALTAGSGLALIVLAAYITGNIEVLYALIVLSVMLYNVSKSKEKNSAFRQGMVALFGNLALGAIVYFTRESNVMYGTLGVLLLMLVIDNQTL